MPLYLVTSVCDEGVEPADFRVVEAASREAVAGNILADPHAWERVLRNTRLWHEVTASGNPYGEPRAWTPADLLAAIAGTKVDGDSENQVRIPPVPDVLRILDVPPAA